MYSYPFISSLPRDWVTTFNGCSLTTSLYGTIISIISIILIIIIGVRELLARLVFTMTMMITTTPILMTLTLIKHYGVQQHPHGPEILLITLAMSLSW